MSNGEEEETNGKCHAACRVRTVEGIHPLAVVVFGDANKLDVVGQASAVMVLDVPMTSQQRRCARPQPVIGKVSVGGGRKCSRYLI